MKNPNEDKTVDTKEYNGRLMNNVVRMPFKVIGGHAQDLVLDDGGRLADWWGDEGVCSLGYNTPEVTTAVAEFHGSSEFWPHQLPDIYPHPKRFEAAEIICDRTGMDRIFFSNSGTEANEAAIKIARKYWWDKDPQPKHVILTLEGNFHGRTGLSLAAGDFRVSPYHRHGFGPVAQGFGVINEQFKQVAMDSMMHVGEREPNWDTVAAIIMAPVLGNNLVRTYPKEFWSKLKEIREQNDVLLIYDDVQAGSGRAGYYATWQHPDIQVKPDIMTLAKGIAMGYPMSCMLASEEVAAAFTPGVHFNTFGGSPFVCHMATKLYEWLDGNLDDVRNKGQMIRDFFEESDWIKEYDGSGLLNAFTPDYEKFGYDGFQFVHMARDCGLSLATHRQHGPIRFTPPLNVTPSAILDAFAMLAMAHERLNDCCKRLIAK